MAQDIELKIKAAVEAAEAAKSVGELRRSIKDLESLAIQAGDANQEAFNKATAAAAVFSDKIEDTKKAINTFKGDTIETLSGGLGKLRNDLLNLDFAGFNEEAGRLAQTAKGLTFKELTAGIKTTTTGFVNLGRVLLTNPIFLLATAVIGIVLAVREVLKEFGLLEVVIEAVTAPLRILKDLILDTIGSMFGLTRATEDDTTATTDNTAERRRQEKALDDQKKAVDRLREAQERLADAQGRTKQEKLREEIDATNERIGQLRITISRLSEQEEFLSPEFKNQLTLARTELQTLLTERKTSETEISNIEETEQKKRDENAAAAAAKRKAEREKEVNEEKKRQEDITKKIIDENTKRAQEQADLISQIEALENDFEDSQLSQQQREENAVRDKYFAIIEAAREAGLEIITLEEAQEAELKAIRDAAAEDRKQKENETQDAILQGEEELQRLKEELVIGGLQTISSLIGVFAGQTEKQQRKAFNSQKALGIAEATISTYVAAQSAYRGQLAATIPPDPTGPIRAAIAAGTAIASGLARVAAIAKTKFEGGSLSTSIGGGSFGGGSFGGGGLTPPPTFNPQQFFGLGQGSINNPNNGQPDTRVFVVESDITNTQRRVNVIEDRANIR